MLMLVRLLLMICDLREDVDDIIIIMVDVGRRASHYDVATSHEATRIPLHEVCRDT